MRRIYRFTLIIVFLGIIYLSFVFYSRWSQKRALIQRLEESGALKNRKIVEAYGGDKLTILDFYATPSSIRPGEKSLLCYGVSNSKNVRIEPHVDNVWPSLSHCVEVTPTSSMVYKLIAQDADGNTITATAAVEVY